jgi:hypothetical protein
MTSHMEWPFHFGEGMMKDSRSYWAENNNCLRESIIHSSFCGIPDCNRIKGTYYSLNFVPAAKQRNRVPIIDAYPNPMVTDFTVNLGLRHENACSSTNIAQYPMNLISPYVNWLTRISTNPISTTPSHTGHQEFADRTPNEA